ncbi:MAG: hypothetical protein AB7Q97_03095 [Gammaproteobacteria bacterium]
MDYIDQAQEQIEQALRDALAQRQSAPAVAATGRCLNCGEPLEPQRRWCNAICRDEWARETERLPRD